jgi:hypothetical protein
VKVFVTMKAEEYLGVPMRMPAALATVAKFLTEFGRYWWPYALMDLVLNAGMV